MAALYEISKAAEEDWRAIVHYTLDNFGEKQVQKYTNSLLQCLDDLANRVGVFKEIDIAGYQVLV